MTRYAEVVRGLLLVRRTHRRHRARQNSIHKHSAVDIIIFIRLRGSSSRMTRRCRRNSSSSSKTSGSSSSSSSRRSSSSVFVFGTSRHDGGGGRTRWRQAAIHSSKHAILLHRTQQRRVRELDGERRSWWRPHDVVPARRRRITVVRERVAGVVVHKPL